MKHFFIIISLIISLPILSQDSGTFKVTKKEIKKEKSHKSQNKFIALNTSFAGESTPKVIRNFDLWLGYYTYYGSHSTIAFGGIIGRSNPGHNYNGYTFGAFIADERLFSVGVGLCSIPIEITYKKLINGLDNENLNQYSISTGVGVFPLLFLARETRNNKMLQLYFMATYSYNNNSIDTFKGIYPTLRINCRL